MRILLQQFMEGPTILVMNHIFNRQMPFKTGVMTCKSSVDGIPLGEELSTLSTESLQKIDDKHNSDNLDETTKGLLKAISTSYRAMGHTEEAAKYRRNMFLQLDYYGLNSVFLSTTPCDECSLRVCVYSKPQDWVSF